MSPLPWTHADVDPRYFAPAAVGARAGMPADTTPPAAVTDLVVRAGQVDPSTGQIQLEWTVPGDDGSIGIAEGLDIRRKLGSPIASEADWRAAVSVLALGPDEWAPQNAPAGLRADIADQVSVIGSWFYMVRYIDAAGNKGPLGNSLQFDVTL